jgi:hypothetical protein
VKRLTTAIVMTLCLSAPLQAEVYDPFVLQLSEQGYSDITVGRTWLGRIVINAQRDGVTREIVLNARTGEILGDYANLVGAPVQPHYSTNDESDNDSDGRRPVATITIPEDDTAATIATIGDEPAILDTGTDTKSVGD